MERLEVHKLGGASLRDPKHIRSSARLIGDLAANRRVVVVAAAMAGTTDALLRAADAALAGGLPESGQIVSELLSAHETAVSEAPSEVRAQTCSALHGLVGEVLSLVHGAAVLGELSARMRDRIAATGEKLAARVLAAVLSSECAVAAEPLDADGFLETDDRFGDARPLWGVVERTVSRAVGAPLSRGVVPVVTGFCGRSPDGATTTLGRGGSDLTALVCAAALGADEVTIWTDVPGVLTADPAVIPNARTIPHLSYREAAELSFFGARLLHPRTMVPASRYSIPVRIRNADDPTAPGTLIDASFARGPHPVKAVTAARGYALLSVEGKGMAGVTGIAARLFSALAQEGISVTMISQSSSEATICLAIRSAEADAAESALKREFRSELTRGDVDEVEAIRDVGLVAAVGLGMAHTPGVASRVFAALAGERISARAIAQGSSEFNITVAVDGARVDDAVRAVHHAFGLHLGEG
jgi:aspartate kinase